MSNFFKKEVDLNNREAMISFLENHFRYYTLHSWNRSTSYAHNVKLHSLDLPAELMDAAYSAICAEVQNPDWNMFQNILFSQFLRDHG